MIAADASSLTFWESFSQVGFIMVIVGVVGEVAELIVKWVERKRHKAIPKKELKWLLPFETSFFFVLVIGLAMEFLGSHMAMRISNADNARLNEEAGLARKDAAGAIKQAEDANERAAKFEYEAAVLQKEMAEAKTNIIKIDPRNQPLSSLTVVVKFQYRTNVIFPKVLGSEQPRSPNLLGLALCLDVSRASFVLHPSSQSEDIQYKGSGGPILPTSPVFQFGKTMTFSWSPIGAFPPIPEDFTVSEFLNENGHFFIAGVELPPNSRIISGSIDCTANASLKRTFPIPPQWPVEQSIEDVAIPPEIVDPVLKTNK